MAVLLSIAIALVLHEHTAAAQSANICKTFTTFTGLSDTFVRQSDPTQNFGTSEVLRVDGASGDEQLALLHFNLSVINSGASVASAKLALQLRGGGPRNGVHAFASPRPWDPSTVTWSNFVPVQDPPSPDGDIDHDTQVFDVTGMVSDWINGVRPNYGVVLAGGDARYDSTRTNHPPALQICFAPGPPNCSDGLQDGDEVDVDCGGSCPPCGLPDQEPTPSPARIPCVVGGVVMPPDSPICRFEVPQAKPYALFATGRIFLGDQSTVTGDVSALDDPCDCGGTSTVNLGVDVSVDPASTISGPSVFLSAGDVVGAVRTNALSGTGSYSSVAPFVAPVAPFPLPTYAPGGGAVLVHRRRALAPGSYDSITVDAGATLELEGGDYNAASLTLGAGARVLVREPSQLTTGPIVVGDGARIAPTAASRSEMNLTLVSNATDASGAVAVRVGNDVTIAALVNAMDGTTVVGNGLSLTGSLASHVISIGSGAHLRHVADPPLACSFTFCTPTATGFTCVKRPKTYTTLPCQFASCSPTGGLVINSYGDGVACSTQNLDRCDFADGVCVTVNGQQSCQPIVGNTGVFKGNGAPFEPPLGSLDDNIAVGLDWVWVTGNFSVAFYPRNPDGTLNTSALDGPYPVYQSPGPGQAHPTGYLARVFDVTDLNLNANVDPPLTPSSALPCDNTQQPALLTCGTCPYNANNANLGSNCFTTSCFQGHTDATDIRYDCHRRRFLTNTALRNPISYPLFGSGFPAGWAGGTIYNAANNIVGSPQGLLGAQSPADPTYWNFYQVVLPANGQCQSPNVNVGGVPPQGTGANISDGPGGCTWSFLSKSHDDVCFTNISTNPNVLQDLHAQNVIGVSETENPHDGMKFYWFPNDPGDLALLGLGPGFVSISWASTSNSTGAALWSASYANLLPDSPVLMLASVSDLMDGNLAEGLLPPSSVHIFTASALGFPSCRVPGCPSNANPAVFVPVVQHGVVPPADGIPEPDAAFFIQQYAATGADQTELRILSVFPKSSASSSIGNQLPQGLTTATAPRALGPFNPPPPQIGLVLAATLQQDPVAPLARLHFVSESNNQLLYGWVDLQTTHDNGAPGTPGVQLFDGITLSAAFPSTSASALLPARATIDVTPFGTAIVPFSNNDPSASSPNQYIEQDIWAALFPTLTRSAPQVAAVQTLKSGSPYPANGTTARIDYVNVTRDPFYPWQAWFAYPASTSTTNPNGGQLLWLGAVRADP